MARSGHKRGGRHTIHSQETSANVNSTGEQFLVSCPGQIRGGAQGKRLQRRAATKCTPRRDAASRQRMAGGCFCWKWLLYSQEKSSSERQLNAVQLLELLGCSKGQETASCVGGRLSKGGPPRMGWVEWLGWAAAPSLEGTALGWAAEEQVAAQGGNCCSGYKGQAAAPSSSGGGSHAAPASAAVHRLQCTTARQAPCCCWLQPA